MFSNYTALFDSCVLYPAQLRDVLLTLAGTGLFRARWTDAIHEEWMAAVAARTGVDRSRLERTRALMDRAVPGCLVTGYEGLIGSLTLPDPNDRHVLAAAIVARADVIVTQNLKDFPEERLRTYDIEVQHPDDFVFYQLDLQADVVLGALHAQRRRLKNPPVSGAQFLDALEKFLPLTVGVLRDRMDRL